MNFEQATMWRRLKDEHGNYYCRVAEPERDEFRRFFEGVLHQGRTTVEFTKSDGTQRVMICTLSEDHGAKYRSNDTDVTKPTNRARKDRAVNNDTDVITNSTRKDRAVNNEVRTVWDCEAGAWRSFRWDRLVRVEFTLG